MHRCDRPQFAFLADSKMAGAGTESAADPADAERFAGRRDLVGLQRSGNGGSDSPGLPSCTGTPEDRAVSPADGKGRGPSLGADRQDFPARAGKRWRFFGENAGQLLREEPRRRTGTAHRSSSETGNHGTGGDPGRKHAQNSESPAEKRDPDPPGPLPRLPGDTRRSGILGSARNGLRAGLRGAPGTRGGSAGRILQIPAHAGHRRSRTSDRAELRPPYLIVLAKKDMTHYITQDPLRIRRRWKS